MPDFLSTYKVAGNFVMQRKKGVNYKSPNLSKVSDQRPRVDTTTGARVIAHNRLTRRNYRKSHKQKI